MDITLTVLNIQSRPLGRGPCHGVVFCFQINWMFPFSFVDFSEAIPGE